MDNFFAELAFPTNRPSGESWVFINENPQPWDVKLGLGYKNGKPYPKAVPVAQLVTFQKALAAAIASHNPHMVKGDVEVKLFVWRQIEQYRNHKNDRTNTKKRADATNMQKAIEDAIQNVLIENDRNVRRITTEVVEQARETTGAIVICVSSYDPEKYQKEIPDHILANVLERDFVQETFDNSWNTGNVF